MTDIENNQRKFISLVELSKEDNHSNKTEENYKMKCSGKKKRLFKNRRLIILHIVL